MLLEYQQKREDVEHEPLETEAGFGAVVQHLLGRIVTGHLKQSLIRRDAAV